MQPHAPPSKAFWDQPGIDILKRHISLDVRASISQFLADWCSSSICCLPCYGGRGICRCESCDHPPNILSDHSHPQTIIISIRWQVLLLCIGHLRYSLVIFQILNVELTKRTALSLLESGEHQWWINDSGENLIRLASSYTNLHHLLLAY